MSEKHQSIPDEAAGLFYALAAYAIWGVVPLYWRLLGGVGAFEITVHRILWCAIFSACVTVVRGRATHFLAIFASPRIIAALSASSALITLNWTVFIWCVTSHQLVEASLGYYLTPLVSIGLGVALLGERISPIRIVALLLASAAVLIKTLQFGHLPWIAPALALSFGFYGYVRKLTPVDAFDGLATETALLFPVAAILVAIWAVSGTGAFPSPRVETDLLLILAGPLTAVPLVLFAAGARRLRMTTLGFLQYSSPTITLLVATAWLGERFTRTDAFAFACVWSALLLVTLEAQRLRAGRRLSST
ncbi:MAG: EamA family transporter RarD [Alphaproteobacteria bacterium]|nr:EamA family transporter RarD [Alphaproteobacteria bacterium]